MLPGSGRLGVEDEDWHDRLAGFGGGVQRGLVSQAEVVAEPEQDRGNGLSWMGCGGRVAWTWRSTAGLFVAWAPGDG